MPKYVILDPGEYEQLKAAPPLSSARAFAGYQEGRSAQVNLPRPTVASFAPANWVPLVRIGSSQPTSRVLRVSVRLAGSADDSPTPNYGIYCGNLGISTFSDLGDAGALKIKLGAQGVLRTLYCDLQSGDYVLPASDSVEVECGRWRTDLVLPAATADYVVAAGCIDGDSADFRPMTCTLIEEIPLATTRGCILPVGAYAWDIAADTGTVSWTILAGDGPIFQVTGKEYALMDYVTPRRFPYGQVLPIAAGITGSAGTANGLNVTNMATVGPGPHRCKLTFYVR